MRVRREERAADDGYRSELAPGLRASTDGERLADELQIACGVLGGLASDGPVPADREQATWECFLAVYRGPDAAATDWRSGELGDVDAAEARTLDAYRRWAARADSQEAALVGDVGWSPGRRFARAFERLALPGLERAVRFRFLVVLGARGLYDLQPDVLHLLGDGDATERAAKRVFGIGDVMNLERRARAFAQATETGLDALDLALVNWARGNEARVTFGVGERIDEDAGQRVRAALGLS